MDRDMDALVRGIIKDMQWNKSVEKIAKKHKVSVEVVEVADTKVRPYTASRVCMDYEVLIDKNR